MYLVFWRVEILDHRVVKELDALAPDVRQRFLRIAHLIEEHGMAAMHEPYVKHLEGKLWEMRMKGKDGIARAISSPPRASGSWSSMPSSRRRRRRRRAPLRQLESVRRR